MLRKISILSTLVGLSALLFSAVVTAGGDIAPPPPPLKQGAWYLGAAIGYGKTNWSDLKGSSLTNVTVGARELETLTTQDVSAVDDDGCFAARVFGGREFNAHLALQLGYTWLCRPKLSTTQTVLNESPQGGFTPGPTTTSDINIKLYGVDLLARLKAPIASSKFDVWGVAGLGYLHASGNNGFSSRGHFGPAYGAGASYNFNPSWSADVQWLRYSGYGKKAADWLTSDYLPSADFYGVGLTYTFS